MTAKELQVKTAYSKNNPLHIDVGWTRDYIVATEIIKKVLLDESGVDVVFPTYDEYYVELQKLGHFWKTDKRSLLVLDDPYDTKESTRKLFDYVEKDRHKDEDKEVFMMYGYALIEGYWRRHLWAVDTSFSSNLLIDKTAKPSLYYGFAVPHSELPKLKEIAGLN